MLRFLSRYWWVMVLRGVIAILFGVLAFALPMNTLAALVLVFGAYVLTDGIFTVVEGISGRRITPHWWVVLLQGFAGIAVGLMTFFHPALTALVLLLYIAFWAIVVGALQLYAALKLRHEIKGEGWLAFAGILGIAFGVLLLSNPGRGALAALGMIAIFAIMWGIALMIGGFGVHRLATRRTA